MKILALLLSLSILVFIHELGHYMFARIFKTRVEKFYLFFNPSFSILRAKKINGKWKFSWFSRKSPQNFTDNPEKTEWGLGWLPLGGYCAIAGMIDEQRTSAEALASEPQPWEYRSKKAWQRLLIVLGGVLINFVGAIVIFSAIAFCWGKVVLPMKNVTLGYDYCDVALKNGFQNGDIILEVNGETVNELHVAVEKLLLEKTASCTVLRNGEEITFALPSDFVKQFLAAKVKVFAAIRTPLVVDELVKDSPAEKSGLQAGDQIIGINSDTIKTFGELIPCLGKHKGEETSIAYIRNNEEKTGIISISEEGKIGVGFRHPLKIYETTKIEYGFFAAIPAGIEDGWNRLVLYTKQFKILFSKEGASQVGGFASIGNMFPTQWNWLLFWEITGFLSIILAFMNILPIPALDGGHVMFVLWEMISGRKPGDKFLEKAQLVGMILLFSLLILANGNDLIRWIGGNF